LSGTEGAALPFWSPDSRFIGFFTSGKLKKVEVSGGAVQTICDVAGPRGGTWNRDGVIVFGTGVSGLLRVSAVGGDVTAVTTLESTRQEVSHYFPFFLPDNRRLLYYIRSARKEVRGTYIGSLDQPMKQRLLGADSNAMYAIPGYLVFIREEALLAQPFDARELRLTGEPFQIAERVARDPNFSQGSFSISNNGVLIYDPGLNRQSKQLVWVDRQGKQIRSLGAVGGFSQPSLSPDEKRVVVDRLDDQTDTSTSGCTMRPLVTARASPLIRRPICRRSGRLMEIASSGVPTGRGRSTFIGRQRAALAKTSCCLSPVTLI
jgi:eukaryotic-like serine/threonine-protein kinase